MGSDTPNIKHTGPICSELFDPTPISSPLFPTIPSHVNEFHESLGDIIGYNRSFDPYSSYLEDVLRIIMWSTFFDNGFHFSMAFDEFKRPLTLFSPSFLVFSYSHHFETHATTYDKLLTTLTTSEWSDLSLDMRSGSCSSSLLYHLSEAYFRCTQHLTYYDRSNPFLFSSFLFVHRCVYLGLWLCGWSILRWNSGFFSWVGYNHPCMSFVYSCVLLLVVFLALCVYVVGGVACVYMCIYLVDWVRLCFGMC